MAQDNESNLTPTSATASASALAKNCLQDLENSLLKPNHIAARTLGYPELAACNIAADTTLEGYVIPYFDIDGNPVKYYRVKLLATHNPVIGEKSTSTSASAPVPVLGIKYMQPKGSLNHIYFPPMLKNLLKQRPNYIIITEGEKKAACAVDNGFPAVAVSGVYNWKTRTIVLPADTELKQIGSNKAIAAKIPRGADRDQENLEPLPLLQQ